MDEDLNLVPMPKLKNKYLNTLQSLYPTYSNLHFRQSSKFPAKFP
jgi:hypothetical protein